MLRIPPAEFAALPLRAHAMLADFPLHDVHALDLPGPLGCTLADVREVVFSGDRSSIHPAVRFLFGVRRSLGRLLRWDAPVGESPASLSARVDPELAARSRAARPGTTEGPFRVVYVLDGESVHEAINATVHAAIVSALVPHPGGYRLYWAVHVKRTGWITPLYMALIDPFRRLVVYPLLIRWLEREWRGER